MNLGDYELTKIGKTEVKKKTLDPIWNESFLLTVPSRDLAVVLDVFDENRLTRDDFLGRVIIKPRDLRPGVEVKKSHTLTKRSERSNVSGIAQCILTKSI